MGVLCLWGWAFGGSFQPHVGQYAALAASKVHMRSGPGVEYPVTWIYVRPRFPMKVLDVFFFWCHVEDRAGNQGWIHKTLLGPSRWSVITQKSTVYKAPGHGVLGVVNPDVLVHCIQQRKRWCQIRPELSAITGWVSCDVLWGGDQQ